MLTFKQNEIDLADATKDETARPPDMSEVPLRDLLDPHPYFERDRSKWLAEGHKRLTAPLTTLSYAMVGLFSALGGMFRRHGGAARPLITVGAMVVLLALGLAFGTLGARDNSLLFLVWLQATVPGVISSWLLFGPAMRAFPSRQVHVERAEA
jgi:lipopolysaccharide export system permease protein